MNRTPSADAALKGAVSDLEAQGYEVFLEPHGAASEFVGNYRPDAIAIGKGKKIAIQIVESGAKNERAEHIRRALEGLPDWELRVVVVSPLNTFNTLPSQSKGAIAKALSEVQTLTENRHLGPALLLSWATLEALARSINNKEFQRPQTPNRLIEVLARDAIITPNDADNLRQLAQKRNALIHGSLNTRVEKREVERFIRMLAQMKLLSDAA